MDFIQPDTENPLIKSEKAGRLTREAAALRGLSFE